jgi:asparagine synthase (glutamine-hydrolysing)
VWTVEGAERDVKAFTFATGDPAYDELPWVEAMLRSKPYPLCVSLLRPEDVPGLAASVARHEDEPFGGLPTLAYARLFERARENGVTVLLDGQGMDEQWGGYDYYRNGRPAALVQGSQDSPVRPDCLVPDFRAAAEALDSSPAFPDRLRSLQYRDTRYTKIPRALRFNDRASMRSSRELREPFLDHRLFELALRQPAERKIAQDRGKVMLRRIAAGFIPPGVFEAPKRPVQTPQREWLRGPLRDWAQEQIELALDSFGGTWLDREQVRSTWSSYLSGAGDNSFYVWQWISLGFASAREASCCHG